MEKCVLIQAIQSTRLDHMLFGRLLGTARWSQLGEGPQSSRRPPGRQDIGEHRWAIADIRNYLMDEAASVWSCQCHRNPRRALGEGPRGEQSEVSKRSYEAQILEEHEICLHQ